MILLGWESLFDALKCFKQFSHTLGHSTACEFVLVLSLSRDHPEDVTCKVRVIKGLYSLGELSGTFRVEQTGQ